MVTVYSVCRRMENSFALQGRWLEGPEGFPVHFHIRMANRRVVTQTNAATDLQSGATGAADFRIRKSARTFNDRSVRMASKEELFFGLQILILQCVGLQIPRNVRCC